MIIIKNQGADLMPLTKINSKWTVGSNVKHRILKPLENHVGENLYNLGYGPPFLI